MNPLATYPQLSEWREYAVWLVALLAVAFGFRHFREIMTLVLEELYRLFILNNPVR